MKIDGRVSVWIRVSPWLVVALVLAAGGMALGQTPTLPTLTFDVASVKRNKSGETRIRFETPPGSLTAINVPLRFVIRQAYRVPEARVLGGPTWLDTERFDIAAKAPAGTGRTSDDIRQMLRTLLAERFALRLHTEDRNMPVYSLTLARADGRLGPNLRPSTTDCADRKASVVAGRVQCGILVSQAPTSASLRGGGATMAEFVRLLGDFLDRPLMDDAGLTGTFDLELQFAALRSALPGASVPGGLGVAGGADDIPNLFTAVQEQLGLRLESRRAVAQVLVIDDVSEPSEN
jgi:uncharacterized protein (TIGR03435 family)